MSKRITTDDQGAPAADLLGFGGEGTRLLTAKVGGDKVDLPSAPALEGAKLLGFGSGIRRGVAAKVGDKPPTTALSSDLNLLGFQNAHRSVTAKVGEKPPANQLLVGFHSNGSARSVSAKVGDKGDKPAETAAVIKAGDVPLNSSHLVGFASGGTRALSAKVGDKAGGSSKS